LWDDPNPWSDVWSRNVATSGLVPIKPPIGDLTDIGTVSAEQAENGSMERLAALAKRYGADVAVVASADVSGATGAETVDVTVTRYDPNSGPQVFGVQENTLPDETLNETLVRAAKAVQDQLADGWKRANLINYSTGGSLMVFIPITGLQDWAKIEDKLIGLPVVRNSRVVAMSRREVQLSLDFVGSTSQLQTALNQQNLNLTRMGELWFIQPTGSDRLQGLSIGGEVINPRHRPVRDIDCPRYRSSVAGFGRLLGVLRESGNKGEPGHDITATGTFLAYFHCRILLSGVAVFKHPSAVCCRDGDRLFPGPAGRQA
jgi:hypothetical protein